MTLECVCCGKSVDGHADGHLFACMRRLSVSRSLRLTVIVLQKFGVVKKND